MNYTFSFYNVLLMYISSKNSDCPHTLYNEDIEAKCCQNEIVALHNKYRAIIANGENREQLLSEVPHMVWNDKLAHEAQVFASECNFNPSTNETVAKHGLKTGERLLLKCSTDDDINANWTNTIETWFNKYQLYRYSRTKTENFDYTKQLMWAESNLVGCGYSNYKIKESNFSVGRGITKTFANDGLDYCQFYVCYYGFRKTRWYGNV